MLKKGYEIVLRPLLWLPVCQRTDFKILLMVYAFKTKWSQLKVPFTPLRSSGITSRTKPHKAPILDLIQSRLNFDAPSTGVLLYCLLSLEKQPPVFSFKKKIILFAFLNVLFLSVLMWFQCKAH